jgi:hypothetical protein
MRFFKFHAALLALIFTIVAGALLFVVVRIFGNFTEFGTPLNFISWFFFWLLQSPCYYLPRSLGDELCVPFCLLQLWLMFFGGVTFVRFVFRNNNPGTLKMAIATVTIALFISLGLLINLQFWQNSNWKEEAGYLAGVQGAEAARKDFDAGKLKLFVISGECHEDKYSGSNDGPFEIWTAEYYPAFPYPERYPDEKKVEAYNLRMRSLYKWSLTHTNNRK